MSLTNKITLVILAAILCPSLFIFSILYASQSSSFTAGRISRLQEITQLRKAEIISANFSDAVLQKTAKDYAFLSQTGEILILSNQDDVLSLVSPVRFPEAMDAEHLKSMLAQVQSADIPSVQEKTWEKMIDYRGYEVSAIAESLEGSNLVLFIKQDIAEYKKLITNATNIFLLTFFVISIFGIFIGLSVGKSLADPLRRLSFTIAEFTKNPQRGIRSSIISKDETGTIASSFNEMAKKLNELHLTLEKKVADRTAQLNLKTEESEKNQKAVLNILEDLEKEKVDLQKFRLAVDNSSEHVTITDLDGMIIYANKAVQTITGFTPDEVLGKKAGTKDNWGGEMTKAHYQAMWKTIKEEKRVYQGFIKNKRKDGTLYDAATTIIPLLNASGDILFFVEVLRDVTKEKEIDRAKSEFVSLASHQLRTPLSTINWYAEMLIAGDAGKLKKEQQKYLGEIYRGNQRMVELVNALLNVSRIELGTFMVDPEPTDVVALAKKVVEDEEPNIFKRKIGLAENYETKLPQINVDPKLMRMVLQNLLSNAVKYTPEGGKVAIEVKRDKNNALITVADTGYGIPKNQQDKIFTKLFRADNVRAMDTEGTGLGLYIVKSIVEYSRGKIWFESHESKGTTFTVTLPLAGMQKKEGTKALGS